jgi:predicted transcriptional regulator
MAENGMDELLRWIISVDRRLILLEYMRKHTVANASEIAHESNRSIQNISHALKELEDVGLIECLTLLKLHGKNICLQTKEKW